MCADLFDGVEPAKADKAGAKEAGDSSESVQRTWYCSRCRSPMRRIVGKMGPFWGCTAYPACDKRMYDLDGHPSETPDERYRCPVCTRPMVRAEGKATSDDKSRDDYWYCTGYNKGCKVTLPDEGGKPADAWRCERCGHLLKQRRGKNGLFWGCSKYPLCTVTYPDLNGKPKGPGFE